mgnify:CR=1 FL=1
MKKLLTSILLLAASMTAHASGVINILGTDYAVDTLFHNQIGPGTTQTSLWLHNSTDKLRVFYTTMDMTNPYLSLHGVVATDKLAGNERISAMAQRKSAPGKRYFLGINADFFKTSGTTARGVSMVGTPVGSTVVDGTIFRARNGSKTYKNIIVEENGNMYCNPFSFGGTVKNGAGTSAKMGYLNCEYLSNAVNIYNDLFYGSTSQAAEAWCVTARLADGAQFTTTGPVKLVVTSEPEFTADATIPSGGYVLYGHGTTGDFVKALTTGEEVTVELKWSYNGQNVTPYNVISGNPKVIENGEILDSEGDRTDASAKHPRSAVGFSDGGNKAYFLVVDGRSLISNGIRTKAMAHILKYIGCTDGMNVDGGGSAVLYTSPLGIRNVPSDGSERADGNGFFCVSSAPDDDVIASIRFVDFSIRTPKYGMYTPKFYGYNQYGMLIDTDVKGVKLSCPGTLGEIVSDTTFYGTGEGVDLLTATLGDISVSTQILVGGSVDDVKIKFDSIINDGHRDYPVDVESVIIETVMPINPAALEWQSTDESIVAVGTNTGVLRGVADGEALVVGTLNGRSDTLKVVVQTPKARTMPIDPENDVTQWKVTQTGGKDVVLTPKGEGFTYEYTGASSRAPKITMSRDFDLWSLPDTLRVRLNPGEAPVKGFTFGLRSNGGGINYCTVTPEAVSPNVVNTFDVPTASWMDADNMGNYPIHLSSIQVAMGTSTTSKQYTMEFAGIETVYKCMPLGPVYQPGDINGDGAIDISDVNCCVNVILGSEDAGKYGGRADVNGDGVVDIQDVNYIINIILS